MDFSFYKRNFLRFNTILIFLIFFLQVNVASLASKGEITIYTSQPDNDIQTLVEAFNEKYKEISIKIFRSGTVEVLNKFKAEIIAGETQADILLISDVISMENLKKENHLFSYKEAKVENLPENSYDKDKTYFGTKYITIGIAYNKKENKRPTLWSDLNKPEFKNMVVIPDPFYSGAALVMVSELVNNTKLGWKFFRDLKSNGAQLAVSNGAVLNSVLRGEKSFGITLDFMTINAKNKGAPIDFIYPLEGAPIITEPIAILKSSKNKTCAQIFVDFILSEEGQKVAESIGYNPICISLNKDKKIFNNKKLKINNNKKPVIEEIKNNFSNIFR